MKSTIILLELFWIGSYARYMLNEIRSTNNCINLHYMTLHRDSEFLPKTMEFLSSATYYRAALRLVHPIALRLATPISKAPAYPIIHSNKTMQ
jgi:hypothetical protein